MEILSKQIDCHLDIQKICERDVEDDIVIFLTVYDNDLPPIDYVRKFMKISQRRYDMFEIILLNTCYKGTIEDIKQYIRDDKLNFQHTEKYLNLCVKLVFEYNKEQGKVNQINYYPEIKIMFFYEMIK